MKRKKTAALFVGVLLLAGALYMGVQYYFDYVKLPDIPPHQVVERYFDALKKRKYQDAYQMVSRQYYFESYNQFVDRVSMYASDMTLEIGEGAIEENKALVAIKIAIPMRFGMYRSDTEMDLVRDKRQWKIIHP